MNQHVKNYLLRGLIFGGFGPIVAGIVLFILHLTGVNVNMSGTEVFIAIISTYILAFVQAGQPCLIKWKIGLLQKVCFSTFHLSI